MLSTSHAYYILLCAIKYLGAYFNYIKPPINTITFGKQLKTIIYLQFPSVKLSKKQYAKMIPYNLPKETQELINNMPLPRYLIGDIYANIVVVKEMEKPNEKPYINLATIIC